MLSILAGAAIMFLLPNQSDGFVYGMFVAVLGNFIMLNYKYYKNAKSDVPEPES